MHLLENPNDAWAPRVLFGYTSSQVIGEDLFRNLFKFVQFLAVLLFFVGSIFFKNTVSGIARVARGPNNTFFNGLFDNCIEGPSVSSAIMKRQSDNVHFFLSPEIIFCVTKCIKIVDSECSITCNLGLCPRPTGEQGALPQTPWPQMPQC